MTGEQVLSPGLPFTAYVSWHSVFLSLFKQLSNKPALHVPSQRHGTSRLARKVYHGVKQGKKGPGALSCCCRHKKIFVSGTAPPPPSRGNGYAEGGGGVDSFSFLLCPSLPGQQISGIFLTLSPLSMLNALVRWLHLHSRARIRPPPRPESQR